jgi:hypothetical protein
MCDAYSSREYAHKKKHAYLLWWVSCVRCCRRWIE